MFILHLPFLLLNSQEPWRDVEKQFPLPDCSPRHSPSTWLTAALVAEEKCSSPWTQKKRGESHTTPIPADFTNKHSQTLTNPRFNKSNSSTDLSIFSHWLLLFIQLRGESVRVTDSFHSALAETLGNRAFLQHYKRWLLWGGKQGKVRRQKVMHFCTTKE